MVLELGLLIVLALAVVGLGLVGRAQARSLTQMTQILSDMAYRTQTTQYVFHKGDRAPDMYERYPVHKDEPRSQTGPDTPDDFDKPQDIGPEHMP